MSRTLTVHIGTSKTGSTSIQAFLDLNREPLRDIGIFVPTSLGKRAHNHAALASLDRGQGGRMQRNQGVESDKDLKAYRKKVAKRFKNEIRGSDSDQVVISSELLSSPFRLPEYVARFNRLFVEPFDFDRVKVAIYLRPQLDHLISLYTTRVSDGMTLTLDELIKKYLAGGYSEGYFDYKGIVERWAAIPGYDISVRPYKALPAVSDGGAVADFCDLLGTRHDDPRYQAPDRDNASINSAGQQLLRLMNSGGRLPEDKRRQLVNWCREHCSGKGDMPDPSRGRAFEEQYESDNAWIAERWFPDHPDYLRSSWLQRQPAQ